MQHTHISVLSTPTNHDTCYCFINNCHCIRCVTIGLPPSICPITARRIWKTAARIRTVSHSFMLHISHISYARTKPNKFYRNNQSFCRLRFQTCILKNSDPSGTDKDSRTLTNVSPQTCKEYRTLLFAKIFRGKFLQLEFISECVNLYMNRPMCLTKMNFYTIALVLLLYVILCTNTRDITTYQDISEVK